MRERKAGQSRWKNGSAPAKQVQPEKQRKQQRAAGMGPVNTMPMPGVVVKPSLYPARCVRLGLDASAYCTVSRLSRFHGWRNAGPSARKLQLPTA